MIIDLEWRLLASFSEIFFVGLSDWPGVEIAEGEELIVGSDEVSLYRGYFCLFVDHEDHLLLADGHHAVEALLGVDDVHDGVPVVNDYLFA